MKVRFENITTPQVGCVVVMAAEGPKMCRTALAVDRKIRGQIRRAVKSSQFTGKKSQIIEILTPRGIRASKVLLLGIGKAKEIDELAAESLGGRLAGILNREGDKVVFIAVDPIKGLAITESVLAAHIAIGIELGSYRFNRFKTIKKKEHQVNLKTVTVMTDDASAARRIFGPQKHVVNGVFVTRDLVTEPANHLYPETFAEYVAKFSSSTLKVEILNPDRIRRLKMGALLGVAQGSSHKPRVVVIRYDGGSANEAPIAFVGKGVTFDSGGISIKPSQGMEDMKWDMGGAAVVTGLMTALSRRRAKVNVVGIIGLVENMPSGTAQRPGDVVISMSGQTIEVINTDAEGRLVLADALWYTQQRFKPKIMIDLATLTGAIIVALGDQQAGLFSNDDSLADSLVAAGKHVGELVWRFPLSEAYDKKINSQIADVKNVGDRGAGSITAAQFLQRFTNKVPWAHLDIAGVTWSNNDRPTIPKGGTGFGVRLLDRFVSENYEQ